MIFGKNVEIGPFTQISANNFVQIGDDVIMAPNVFISDHNHQYEDISRPISMQGQREKNAKVIIGEGSWIAKAVVIVGDIKIGKHCVIGANSVVTQDVPDYSVAVGVPAKVIKKYDFSRNQWVKINTN